MILLDSDVLIEILDKKSEKGNQALRLILESDKEFFTSAIALHEVLYGLHKRRKSAEDTLLVPILDYTKTDALLSSKIELEMEEKGTPIERADTMIAAIAITNEAELYTFNVKHFSLLKSFGLKLFP